MGVVLSEDGQKQDAWIADIASAPGFSFETDRQLTDDDRLRLKGALQRIEKNLSALNKLSTERRTIATRKLIFDALQHGEQVPSNDLPSKRTLVSYG